MTSTCGDDTCFSNFSAISCNFSQFFQLLLPLSFNVFSKKSNFLLTFLTGNTSKMWLWLVELTLAFPTFRQPFSTSLNFFYSMQLSLYILSKKIQLSLFFEQQQINLLCFGFLGVLSSFCSFTLRYFFFFLKHHFPHLFQINNFGQIFNMWLKGLLSIQPNFQV